MPLIKIREYSSSSPHEVFANAHECYDWQISDPSPDEIRRIPPNTWLGQILYPSHGIDPSTSFLDQSHSGLSRPVQKNDTKSEETSTTPAPTSTPITTIPVVTTQL